MLERIRDLKSIDSVPIFQCESMLELAAMDERQVKKAFDCPIKVDHDTATVSICIGKGPDAVARLRGAIKVLTYLNYHVDEVSPR